MRAWLAIPALAAGCGDGVDWIGYPPAAGNRSAVIALISPAGAELRAVAFPDPPALAFDQDLARDRAASIEAWFYAETLDELGIAPGPVAIAAGGSPLPAPDLVYRSEIVGGSISDWSAATPSPVVTNLRVLVEGRSCGQFASETLELPEATSSFDLQIALSPDTALIATQGGLIWTLGPSGLERITDVPPGLPTNTASIDERGEIWFADTELWRGTVRGGRIEAVRADRGNLGESIFWISAGGGEVFGLTRYGCFFHFTGGEIRCAFRFDPDPLDEREGGVARIGPGEAIAVFASGNVIARAKNGTVTTERLELRGIGLNGVDVVPGFGPLIGTAAGSILLESGDGWIERRVPDFIGRIRTFALFEGGALAAGGSGVVVRLLADPTQICPASVQSPVSVRRAVPHANGLLLGGGRSLDQTVLTRLRLRP